MIKLFSLKQQKKDGEQTAKTGGQQKKASAAQLRIQKGKKLLWWKIVKRFKNVQCERNNMQGWGFIILRTTGI